MVSPVVPVLHTFEWDAKRSRITGLRFRMSDGSERTIGAMTVVAETDDAPRDPAGDEWIVDVRV